VSTTVTDCQQNINTQWYDSVTPLISYTEQPAVLWRCRQLPGVFDGHSESSPHWLHVPQYVSSFGTQDCEMLGSAMIEHVLILYLVIRVGASLTWSFDTSHSIAASQNRSSVYGMILSRAGFSFRWGLRCCCVSFIVAWQRLFASLGNIDWNLFSVAHLRYTPYSRIKWLVRQKFEKRYLRQPYFMIWFHVSLTGGHIYNKQHLMFQRFFTENPETRGQWGEHSDDSKDTHKQMQQLW